MSTQQQQQQLAGTQAARTTSLSTVIQGVGDAVFSVRIAAELQLGFP